MVLQGFELRYTDWARSIYWVPRHALDKHVKEQLDLTSNMQDAQLLMLFFAPFHVDPADYAHILEHSTRYHHDIQGFDQVIQILHGPYLPGLANNSRIQRLIKQNMLRLVVWQDFQWPTGDATAPYIDQFLIQNYVLLAFWGQSNVRILLNDPDEYVATVNGQRFRDLFLHGNCLHAYRQEVQLTIGRVPYYCSNCRADKEIPIWRQDDFRDTLMRYTATPESLPFDRHFNDTTSVPGWAERKALVNPNRMMLTFYVHAGAYFDFQSQLTNSDLIPSDCCHLLHFENMVRARVSGIASKSLPMLHMEQWLWWLAGSQPHL